jgi:hypothetical protein
MVTMRIGDRRYEMSGHSEVREIANGRAKIIEMQERLGLRAQVAQFLSASASGIHPKAPFFIAAVNPKVMSSKPV